MELDQGTIIYGIRAEKYPGTRCYGIIISASCDIAQGKISKAYYLIAVDAKEWFCTKYGYSKVYSSKINNLFGDFKNITKGYFEPESAREFDEEDFLKVVETVDNKKREEKIVKSFKSLKKYYDPSKTGKNIIPAIREDIKPIKEFLEKVAKREIYHFFFLPQNAYLNNNTSSKGLIVDLQEIGSMSFDEAEKIENDGIDFLNLPSNLKQREKMQEQFWLENKDDFVQIEGNITSPWREYLMQCFSLGFIRIGVDGPTRMDHEKLASEI